MGEAALRVAKPGAYLLAFGGTRTHHRLVCGLEDAGWIIRDELDWIYASGFPKGKANLKPAHEPIVLARKPGPLRPLAIDACRIPGAVPSTVQGGVHSRGGIMNATGPDRAEVFDGNGGGRWPSNLLLSDPALFDEPNPEVVGSGATSEGMRTQNDLVETQLGQYTYNPGWSIKPGVREGFNDSGGYSRFFIVPKADRADREPVVRGQLTSTTHAKYAQRGKCINCGRWMEAGETQCTCGGEYEYQSNGTTQRENAHPTVKPTDLMRHLVRLVTPAGGTVLDCFLGSGSTALACELEGFPWIGIEKDPEYVAIAEARLNGTQRGLGLDVPAPSAPAKRSTGHWPKERTAGSEGWGFTGQTGLEERYDKPPEEVA